VFYAASVLASGMVAYLYTMMRRRGCCPVLRLKMRNHAA
jgi:hypothetical protein